jgi:hypothetical protein|tara:strand:- start:93 stop:1079 length:987 start_codon:yes stop_codon:yes gene_type:complete
MPEEEKKTVPIDTSGPGAEIDLPEDKTFENEVEVSSETTENNNKPTDTSEKSDEQLDVQKEQEQETTKQEEVKKEDDKLEEYSKGVQARIAKLTRKMREAERREQAALEYAKAVEEKRKEAETRFKKTDLDNLDRFEKNISAGLEAAERELAAAIEASDAKGQIAANKRIAELSFENARIKQVKQSREQAKIEEPVQSAPQSQPTSTPMPDPKAEAWASKNTWFGANRAMTNTAIEHHKDLENEGYDTTSDEYYQEIDRRMKVDFPSKFGNNEAEKTSAPVQTVASANRSVKPGRKTVRLTSSQVAIAKKLGVPLEEYAKQLKNTGGA